MKTNCFDFQKWNTGERRLIYFGLEAIPGSRAQRTNPDGTPENRDQRTKRVNDSYPADHAAKLLKQYAEDDARSQNEREEHDIKSSVEIAMNGLDPTVQNFQSQLEQALRGQLMSSTQVAELGPVLRNGRSVTLRRNERDGLNYTIRFLATHDGTAENVRVERAAPVPAADTPEAREKNDAAMRQRWLQEIAKELNAGGNLTLGDVEERVRTPAEQHGIYVNGRHVGDICAGYENGRAVQDPSRYDRSTPSLITFTEAGFKAQVRSLGKQIRAGQER